jgi:hypothetical protein
VIAITRIALVNSMRMLGSRVSKLAGLVVVVAVAAGLLIGLRGAGPSNASRLISCIEARGWRRHTAPFEIADVRAMHLAFDWAGGPGSYVNVSSLTRGRPYELVAISEKLEEADNARLLEQVQRSPRSFEAVLVNEHPRAAGGGEDVVRCSYKIYPNQGP